MNHGPFLSALQAHPQGKQIHSMLTTHLNSVSNAGFKPGAAVAVAKIEMPGKAAAPKEPKEPQMPEVPVAVAPSTNKTTKPPMAKTVRELIVKKSDAEHACSECGLKQFRRDRFVGCMCFRALAKSVTTTPHAEGFILSLHRAQWDEDTIQTFVQALRG
jgi:hypothetical protein